MKNENEITEIQEFIYELKVSQGMTTDVIVVSPEMKMSELGEIFQSKRLSGVPVSENGTVVGFISITEFIKWLSAGENECEVSAKMSRKVKTLFDYSSFVEALNKFGKYSYNCIPVIDENLSLVGVITKGDIIRCILKKMQEEYRKEEIHTYRVSHLFEDIVAEHAVLKLRYSIIGNDFKHAGERASSLKKTLKRLGYNKNIIRKIAIATYEAEMNIVIYTPGGELTAEVDPDNIVIVASDTGPGIEDIEKAMHQGYSTAPDWVRDLGFGAGMGLYNIRKCSDEMKIDTSPGKGTSIELKFSVSTTGMEK